MTGAGSRPVWPETLVFQRGARQLVIRFVDGVEATLPYKYLREQSPSAAVQGHGRGPKPPQAPVPDDIEVVKADPVGRYAVRITFSDGHDSGLYTWDYLRGLSPSA